MSAPTLDPEELAKSSLLFVRGVVWRGKLAVVEVDGSHVDDLDSLLLAHISDSSGVAESQIIGLGGDQDGWALVLVTFHAPIRRRLALWLDLRDDDAWTLLQHIATVDELAFAFEPLDSALGAIEMGRHSRALVVPAPIETASALAGLSSIRNRLLAGN